VNVTASNELTVAFASAQQVVGNIASGSVIPETL